MVLEAVGNDCPNTDDGAHMVEWVDIPALTITAYKDSGRSNRKVYDDHQRGQCVACDQILRRNG